MKRIIAFVLGAAMCLTAAAQSWDEALLFSENVYSGTARGVGMGNALTAIGGDPGSLVFNPAGSAVASYSQFSITPGLTISVAGVTGNFADNYQAGSTVPRGFGENVNTVFGRAKLPNIGFILSMNTGFKNGWKRSSLGFVFNSTGNYVNRYEAAGVNDLSSYAAALASSAEGYSPDVLSGNNWFYGGMDATQRPEWVDKVGYMSGMFNGIPGWPNCYQAITETRSEDGDQLRRWVPAPLYQNYGVQTTGSKNDFLLNYAADYADVFYFGVNLGVTVLRYGMNEYWQERPNDSREFAPIEYEGGSSATFESLRMKRNYQLRGSGIYLKVGALWRPFAGLRLGAAIQTPTFMTMQARNAFHGEVKLGGKSIPDYSSPEDDWGYVMINPFRFNVGAAYTLGSFAVLSADYEMVNYRHASYRTTTGDDMPAYMSDANLDIKDALGISHLFRVGIEIKPTPAFALRAGYNYTTTGQRNFLEYWVDEKGNVQVDLIPLTAQERRAQARNIVSVGAGYAFGSFYLDAAVRARFVPKDYITPYLYYTFDDDYTDKYVDKDMQVPTVQAQSRLFDAMVTLGWRF